MSTQTNPFISQDHRNTFVGISDLMARYGRGKTVVYELVNGEHFPRPVAPGRWRLDHVMAYEDRVAEGVAELPTAAPKARKGPKPARASEQLVDPLAPRQRGRKAAA